MRKYFKTETFPTLAELVAVFKDCKRAKQVCQFFNMYYNTLQSISKVYGFDLVRLEFAELRCIVHRPNDTTIIVNIDFL